MSKEDCYKLLSKYIYEAKNSKKFASINSLFTCYVKKIPSPIQFNLNLQPFAPDNLSYKTTRRYKRIESTRNVT